MASLTDGVLTDKPDSRWWDQVAQDKSAVVAHTPDPKRYHRPDQDANARLATGLVGGTVIPRARADGTSMGFDHNEAGVVHVDPGMPDSVIFDPRQTNSAKIAESIRGVREQGGVVGFADEASRAATFAAMAGVSRPYQGDESAAVATPVASPGPQTRQQLQSGPKYPQGYVVPKANQDGTQAEEPAAVAKVAGPRLDDDRAPAAADREREVMKHGNNLGTPEAATGPDGLPSVEQMSAFMRMMQAAQSLQTPGPPHRSAAALPPAAEPMAPPRSEVAAAESPIPFLAARPAKPGQQVIFELGDAAGTMRARYHAVVEGAGCVVLVYDTRYDEGSQWVPPESQRTVTFHVTRGDARKTYHGVSLGLSFAVGCLDCVLLILRATEPVDDEA